jgi:hypothetical protein
MNVYARRGLKKTLPFFVALMPLTRHASRQRASHPISRFRLIRLLRRHTFPLIRRFGATFP